MSQGLRRAAACAVSGAVLALLSSCASAPDEVAAAFNMNAATYAGAGFDHRVYRRGASGGGSLHIYLGGDGIPWIDGRRPAQDPTTRNPVTLRLMGRDRTDSVYIGRPCYHGHYRDAPCNTNLWTFERYSPAVVRSMAAVANTLIEEGGYGSVVLVGYSGGGVLALLMAPEIQYLAGILTVAANLDTDAWTAHHNYLPLRGSLNPALTPGVPPEGIVHVQAIGLADAEVPQAVTDSYQHHGKAVEVWRYADYDHRCCWEEAWPALIAQFTATLSPQGSSDDATGRPSQ